MGILKCYDCGKYLNDDEVVWVKINDNHDAAYCVNCSPESDIDYDDSYDYE